MSAAKLANYTVFDQAQQLEEFSGMGTTLVAALISEGVVYFCYRVATETMFSMFDKGQIVPFASVAWMLLGIFAAIGVFTGLFGSAIMIGKYLKKEGSEANDI